MTSELEKIEKCASDWLVREDRGLDAAEREAFENWLSQSISHRVAYLRCRTIWLRANRLAALRTPAFDLERHRIRLAWRPRYAAYAAAAVILLACIGLTSSLLFTSSTQVVYSTAVGQQHAYKLADGTKVQLNTNTSMRTSINREKRVVLLDKGEASFDVIHDEKRPFVVYAGDHVITDLGTKFTVRRDDQHVEVVVTQGRVRVDVLRPGADGEPIIANRNDVVIAKADETLVAPKTPQEIERVLSWQHRMLVFRQVTLAEAAKEFNRYNQRQIVVEGDARQIRIGGSFKVENIEGFTSLIRLGFNVKVKEYPDHIVIQDND